MMDILMVAILLVSFGAIKLLADWCERQLQEE